MILIELDLFPLSEKIIAFKDGYADWCIDCEKGRKEYYEHIYSGGTASLFQELKSALSHLQTE